MTWDWQEKQCPLRDVDTTLLMFNLVNFCTRFYKIRPSNDQVQLIFFSRIWPICHHGSVTHLQKGSMNLDVNKVILKKSLNVKGTLPMAYCVDLLIILANTLFLLFN